MNERVSADGRCRSVVTPARTWLDELANAEGSPYWPARRNAVVIRNGHRVKLDNETTAASKILRVFFEHTDLKQAIKDDPEVSSVATCDGRL